MKVKRESLEILMQAALAQARLGCERGEVPVGAVVALDNNIIAEAHNETEGANDVSCHAELLAIRRASSELRSWRLDAAVLCVTLEPCTMCAGAIRLARLPLVVFGAYDEKMGAFGSLFDISQDQRLGPSPRVIGGIMKEECASLLSRFFEEKRGKR